jgi:hypothetical protein
MGIALSGTFFSDQRLGSRRRNPVDGIMTFIFVGRPKIQALLTKTRPRPRNEVSYTCIVN